jgi:hypothetical protein
MSETMRRFAVGQTVRWTAEARADWYESRAADGVAMAGCPTVGRIVFMCDQNGYCGSCDVSGDDCAGPWYAVDFGEGPSTGYGGMYAQHELEAA